MKSKIFVSTMFLGIVLLAGAYIISSFNPTYPVPYKYLVNVTAEDFNKDTHILRQVEVKPGDVFTVALDSNASTGFIWIESAKIADGNILKQTEHAYVAPRANDDTKPMGGMSGIEEWCFAAGQAGVTTATMSYDRPWESGEKGVRTFVLTVIVK